MNFPVHIDQVIHDHQGTLYAEARAHRLAGAARAARSRRRAVRRRQPARTEAADVAMRLGTELERLGSARLDRREERVVADLLVGATVALAPTAESVGLTPLTPGTPLVVAQRWFARLAERTAGSAPLDAAQIAVIAGVVDELSSLSAPATGLATVTATVSVSDARTLRAPRALPTELRGAC